MILINSSTTFILLNKPYNLNLVKRIQTLTKQIKSEGKTRKCSTKIKLWNTNQELSKTYHKKITIITTLHLQIKPKKNPSNETDPEPKLKHQINQTKR